MGTRLDCEGGVVCRNTEMQTRQSDVMITFKTYMFTINEKCFNRLQLVEGFKNCNIITYT